MTAPLPAGLFITFEGGEGAGKSTQCQRLAASFRSKGHDVLVTREPGGAAGAEAIRALLIEGGVDRWTAESEALLFLAARADHLERTIRPALARGQVVICDRFMDSTLAYQGYARGLDRQWLKRLNADIVRQTVPDLTLILDLAPEKGLARVAARALADRFEAAALEFHRHLRDGFLAIAREEPQRCVVVDADAEAEIVFDRVLQALRANFGARSPV